MRRLMFLSLAAALCLAAVVALSVTAVRVPASPVPDLPSGKVDLKSAGALAFGPDGILFVGDSAGGNIVAIDTGDRSASASAAKINIDGIDEKIAALVGASADQIVVNDVKVNPVSKNVYLSAARGRGPDAAPLLLRVDGSGKITPVDLNNAKHASVSLSDAPTGGNQRMQTITNMAFINGSLMVAGLSNEEWSSALRAIPFPFQAAAKGATLQIWHSSHGRYETESPIRTFVPYTISGQSYILAAYTCTPLVKIPVSALTPGAQVKGVEIADLGAGNQPLAMVPYKKDGHSYILIANSSFGVLKLKADNLETYPAIESPTITDVAGVPFDRMAAIKNVKILTQLDDANALALTGNPGSGPAWNPGPPKGPLNLETVALP